MVVMHASVVQYLEVQGVILGYTDSSRTGWTQKEKGPRRVLDFIVSWFQDSQGYIERPCFQR